MPRLLILCEYPTFLGGERSMVATLSAVASAGFEVQVAAPPIGPLADAVLATGVPLVPWRMHDDRGARLPLKQLQQVLARLFERHRPELVHANSLAMARISGPVVAAVRQRSIGHLRDIMKLSPQAVAKLNCHGRLIAVSEATRDFHLAQGLDAEKCVVLNNGVDLNAFQPRPATRYLHRELGLPSGTRLLATVGQLGMRKGLDVALAAAEALFAEFQNVAWLIVGERTSDKLEAFEFEQKLHAAAARSPLAGRVFFLGTRDDVPQILNECALLIHAARQEPLGRVLLEAAASGVPAVATAVGGTREIFVSESDGAVLVSADDADALARATLDLLGDDVRRAALGSAARHRAEAAFDIRDAARRLIDEYREVLSP